jgi:hypothetical protein
MGSYTYGEYLETFGGPPDPDDRSCVRDWRGEADEARDRVELLDRFGGDEAPEGDKGDDA